MPKEGGNAFRGMLEGEWTGEGLQNSNLSERSDRAGDDTPNEVRRIWSTAAPSAARFGAIKVWFYTAYRWWGAMENQAGIYYNKPELVQSVFFEPDLSRPGYTESWCTIDEPSLTWQVTPEHKIFGNFGLQESCTCNQGLGPRGSPESTVDFRITGPGIPAQANWSYPATNRLLFQAGVASRTSDVQNARQPELTPADVGKLELQHGPSVWSARGDRLRDWWVMAISASAVRSTRWRR